MAAPAVVPDVSVEAPLLPWERFAWPPEHEQAIYRDWAAYLTRKQETKSAEVCYARCLELKPDDPKALYMRSVSRRITAQTDLALEEAIAAATIDDHNPDISIALCDAWYESNAFEQCMVELFNNMGKYSKAAERHFTNRQIVVEENLGDSVGDSMGHFILKNGHHFPAVLEHNKRKKHIETRPLWKILKEMGECDVLSILEKKKIMLSPRELSRRERSFRIYNQIYYGRNWIDIVNMRDLALNQRLSPAYFKESMPYLRDVIRPQYEIVKKFGKMLHARSPLYNEYLTKFKNQKLHKQYNENYLNCVQWKTRRNMNTVLATIKQMRNLKQVEKLSNYIESVMGDYVVLKTHRIMPWKFEFMNEVYNTLALAYADQYEISPQQSKKSVLNSNLCTILNLPKPSQDFNYQDNNNGFPTKAETNENQKNNTYKKYIARMLKRRKFAEYDIERCYLRHEMARAHLKHAHFDECCVVARRAIEVANQINSHLWAFLSVMLIVKAHATLGKVEYCKNALDEANNLVKELKCPKLEAFIEIARWHNGNDIEAKKKSQSIDSVRKRKYGSEADHLSLWTVISDTDTSVHVSRHTSLSVE